jgi:hypothetical protein
MNRSSDMKHEHMKPVRGTEWNKPRAGSIIAVANDLGCRYERRLATRSIRDFRTACQTHKDVISKDLLEFVQQAQQSSKTTA